VNLLGTVTADAAMVGKAHLHLQVVQVLGPERGVCIEIWPVGETS
jgi:hypothetical protein